MNELMQYDDMVRLVSLVNLRAMCERASDLSRVFSARYIGGGDRVTIFYKLRHSDQKMEMVRANFVVIRTGQVSNPLVLLDWPTSIGGTAGRDSERQDELYEELTNILLRGPRLKRLPNSNEWVEIK